MEDRDTKPIEPNGSHHHHPEITLSARSYIQLGTLISVVLFAISATWWFSKFDNRLSVIEKAADDRWRRSDMELWTLKFKSQNPTLIIPEVR